jgi:predicted membrane channel-forming protein YqfA (hemolysin III family)
MSAPKLDFINRYIMPIFDPIFNFFEKYGINNFTVLGFPLVLLLFLSLKKIKGNKVEYITTIIGIIFLIIGVIYYQFFGTFNDE